MTRTAPVAIIIPVYNRRLKLIRTLEKVFSQDVLPSKVIVVDDGSTDGTAEAAQDWLRSNASFEWKVVPLGTNAGVSVARNVGFDHIGELPFVCFLDSDDLWPRNFISKALQALTNNISAVASVADRVTHVGRKKMPAQSLRPAAIDPLLWVICNDGGILSCTMIRSAAAQAAGRFAPEMLASEDTDFLLRLFLLGGATHSKGGPVVFIKNAPLQWTEPPNLSKSSPLLKYLWTQHLTHSVLRLPKQILEKHEFLIRTAVARRWAGAALTNRLARHRVRALNCLFQAVWWDYRWGRRLKLVRWFTRGERMNDYDLWTHYPTRLKESQIRNLAKKLDFR